MKQKRVSGLDFFRLRRESREILAQNGNRLTLISAILIAACPLPLYLSVDSVFRLAILPRLGQSALLGVLLEALAILTLTVLITLPLWTGLLRLAAQMEEGKIPPLTEMFHAFSGREAYGEAFQLSASVTLQLAVLAALEWGATLAVDLLFWNPLFKALIGVALYAGVFVLWFSVAARGFLKPYLLKQPFESTDRMQPYAASVGKRYWLGYFPRLTLSLLTFGILLLADTLPEMLISYFRLCKKLNEFTTQSEELIK